MPRVILSQWHQDVGARMKEARHAAGLSMQVLGRRMGMPYQIYQRYEAGISRLPADAAVKVSEALNVDIRWLLGMRGASGRRKELGTRTGR